MCDFHLRLSALGINGRGPLPPWHPGLVLQHIQIYSACIPSNKLESSWRLCLTRTVRIQIVYSHILVLHIPNEMVVSLGCWRANEGGKTNVKDEQPKSTAGKPNVSAAKQKANKEADEDDEESVY
ncbi:hypothetical protein OPV22_029231 [Ensete ventricosum]|uniref:Histone chaperone domain-containing protein n=1 Tax=Ensete ventricosum TaxID=4639 RepID=A0AAV8Q593_ENSVE|nr:hypothetical protein OPV22_029231 [Ensete ventricosum]